jgi:hypothetical protein
MEQCVMCDDGVLIDTTTEVNGVVVECMQCNNCGEHYYTVEVVRYLEELNNG